METKTCTKCGKCKALDQFYFRANGTPRSICKQCCAEAKNQWRANNLEKARAREAKWRENNLEKKRASDAKWRENNLEKKRASDAKWRENNLEKKRASDAKWRAENREKVRASSAKWYSENRERARAIRARPVTELSQSYVARSLGIPVSQLTPELLEAQRENLRNVRITRQLIATLKELSNGK